MWIAISKLPRIPSACHLDKNCSHQKSSSHFLNFKVWIPTWIKLIDITTFWSSSWHRYRIGKMRLSAEIAMPESFNLKLSKIKNLELNNSFMEKVQFILKFRSNKNLKLIFQRVLKFRHAKKDFFITAWRKLCQFNLSIF